MAGDVPAAQRLLLDIIDTVRQPLLVLDPESRVTQANRAFCRTFRVERHDTIGQVLFALGDGQWDIAPLREMLRDKLPLEAQLDDFDVDNVFPGIGRKIMLLNARLVSHGPNALRIILLAIEDVTELRFTDQRLAVQRQELQRWNAPLDEFASVASHDSQEPLRKILSFGERLNLSAGAALEGDALGVGEEHDLEQHRRRIGRGARRVVPKPRIEVREIDRVVPQMIQRGLERAGVQLLGQIDGEEPRVGVDVFVAGDGRGGKRRGREATDATILPVFLASSVPPHQNQRRSFSTAALA